MANMDVDVALMDADQQAVWLQDYVQQHPRPDQYVPPPPPTLPFRDVRAEIDNGDVGTHGASIQIASTSFCS